MPSTAEAADRAPRSLLYALTDDQLARYGEIARDQASAELSRWWLQALLALCAIAAFAWATMTWGIAGIETLGVEASGFGRSVVIGLGVGMVLAYWPYRRVRNWTMWNRHCQAVAEEQTRRRSGMTGYAAGKMPDGG